MQEIVSVTCTSKVTLWVFVTGFGFSSHLSCWLWYFDVLFCCIIAAPGSDGSIVCNIIAKSFSLLTHEPMHLAWWNFARTCTLTASRNLLHIKVNGQGHMGFLCVLCVHDTSWTSRPGFTKCCTTWSVGSTLPWARVDTLVYPVDVRMEFVRDVCCRLFRLVAQNICLILLLRRTIWIKWQSCRSTTQVTVFVLSYLFLFMLDDLVVANIYCSTLNCEDHFLFSLTLLVGGQRGSGLQKFHHFTIWLLAERVLQARLMTLGSSVSGALATKP